MANHHKQPWATVPDPRTVRAELGKRLRELRLLRRLLKLSEAVRDIEEFEANPPQSREDIARG